MKISVIGTGYVGLVSGACLAQKGFDVTCVDIDEEKVKLINLKKTPIYEEGLEEILENTIGKTLIATTDLKKTILDTDITFICVGTPTSDEGKIDLTQVEEVSEKIGAILKEKDSFHVVVMKSTVIPQTTQNIVTPILEKASGKKVGIGFGVCMNPEFLREGVAVYDFINPDRIVLGTSDDKTRSIMQGIYKDFRTHIMSTDLTTAEMIKYASNGFLAAKLSFINEIGNICKKIGISVFEVEQGIGLDHRISPDFLRAGPGFGGSCFPKDVQALIAMAHDVGEEPLMLENLMEVNRRQPLKTVALLKSRIGEVKDKKIGILGLAFKVKTDDMRKSPALTVIEELLKGGADIIAHDPQAMENAKKILGDKISYASSGQQIVDETDAFIIMTDWAEYKKLDYRNAKMILDTRKTILKQEGYEGLYW